MKISFRYLLVFIVSFFSFSLAIFAVTLYVSSLDSGEETYIEDTFLEPSSLESSKEYLKLHEKEEQDHKVITQTPTEPQDNYTQIEFRYLPKSYMEDMTVRVYESLLSGFYYSKPIYNQIKLLQTYLYKDKSDVRGRMKNKKIHLYAPTQLSREEFLAVAIHEFGHFFDLYILQKQVSFDLSDKFYNISWISAKQMQAGMRKDSFVSGYAMTNKYEDFAETYTYYVLHNSDFLERAKKSPILMEKYNFFNDYVFRKGEFQVDDFKITNEIKDYYWDITKIKFDVSKFLRYLEEQLI